MTFEINTPKFHGQRLTVSFILRLLIFFQTFPPEPGRSLESTLVIPVQINDLSTG
jgi:hypothetical protein